MPPKTAATPQPHMGRKIERIRTIKGVKQDVLARQIGVSKSAMSRIEASETVDDDKLQQIADALEMSVEAIKNYNDEPVVSFIQHVHEGGAGQQGNNTEQTNTFNPVERMAEVYERLIAEKDKMITMLEDRLKGNG